ncbi:MAG TPA: hypothetical protein VFI31_21755 [Pirellulales bacterium]|nr:hypothetical protein [Pirellulales bacterium]
MPARGVVRHDRFDSAVEELEQKVPRIRESIEGAVWALARNPEKFGVKNLSIDVWQARLTVAPSSPDVLIFYTIHARYIHLLTVALASELN